MQSKGRLKGKVTLISGASKGTGTAEAKMFAKEGASLVLGDVLEDEGRKLASSISATGAKCIFVPLDVRSLSDWKSAVGAATSVYGKLNVLVNNAGVTSRKMLLDSTAEDWDVVMDINAKGSFLGIKASIPSLRQCGGGSIINISSQLGLVGGDFSSPQYQASKGSVRLLTKAVAIQYASENIRCNSVHPAPIETDMTADIRSNQNKLSGMLRRILMGRYGMPEEVAYAVLYLASDESGFVTGSELMIDGGWTGQ